MKPQYIAITGLDLLTLATAAFGVFGHYRNVNAEMFTNRGAAAPDRGRAVMVANGDFTIACEAWKRVPY